MNKNNVNLWKLRLLIGTRNPSKRKRYSNWFRDIVQEVIDLNDTDVTEKPDETGETAEENAEIKAKFYSLQTKLPCFCEDTALYVDFLPENDQPGTHVRRIEGKEEVSDEELLAYWEGIVSNVPEDKRAGRWHVAYSVANSNGEVKTISSDAPIIFFSPSSEVKLPGWPMSSLQGPVKFNKPHSELTVEENEVMSTMSKPKVQKLIEEFLVNHVI
ncbi:MAG: non-canonical purine NTP pyrophosphatase [Patescibacteria group bacterium]|nr:non-canonical purine NTP pyrophosphatase [Patescibacteria group bacterium]